MARANLSRRVGHSRRAQVVTFQRAPRLYGVYKVYAVEEKKLRETEVKLGSREGDEAEIVDGLKEGDRVAVAVEGDELRDGALLAAAE